ncbi:MAG: glutamine-hydrolyzing GMP synthase, partial [Acidimicrobiaceae bacterium]|nr:glutamine-hydrolyzing GMP synthase [Acidimicrobiaceae bacterium]
MKQAKSSRVVVVDFGAQYAQLIARRIRELHVYSEIVPYSITAEGLLEDPPKAIILSGGPKSVNEAGAPSLDPKIFELGIPILGICYGAQLLAVSLGGKVERNEAGEYGRTVLRRKEADTLLGATPISQKVWMSHFDSISEPPLGATVTGSTDGAKVASFEDLSSGICGVQYHPEVTHTEYGRTVLSNFIFEVAKCDATWTNFSIIEESIALIKERVRDSRVICALSGGVDSSVAAALVHEAIGDQLTCVYVDTGLMRSGETESVIETFRDRFAVDLIAVDASERFFEVLRGVVDPEQKRKAIGETFIRVFEDLRPELGRAE